MMVSRMRNKKARSACARTGFKALTRFSRIYWTRHPRPRPQAEYQIGATGL
jgi:hypothetical protein